jgi:C4-dicarboxylate-specific signal transduction histidine kinase
MNLVMNAAEAMATVTDRERTLRITTEPHQGGVLVQIEDSGSGIRPDEIEHVFKPFYTTKATGMGMGLSISRSIVEAHRGRLWASRAARYGAVLSLALPPPESARLEPDQPPPNAAASNHEPIGAP